MNVSCNNYIRILLLSIYSISFGYYMTIFNPIGDIILRDVYKLDDDRIQYVLGNINMLYGLGAFFSVLSSGYISERIGRRRLIIIFDLSNIVIISLYYIDHIHVLYTVRFLSGWMCSGLGMITSIYMTESLPKIMSGVGNTFMYTILAFSIFISFIQLQIFSRDDIVLYWRYILCWPIIPYVLKIVLSPIFITFESPKYIIDKHHDKEDIRDRLVSVYKKTHSSSQVDLACDETIRLHRDRLIDQENNGDLLYLFKFPLRRRIILGIVLAISEEMCGMTYISIYSTDIFNRVNGSGNSITLTIAITKLIAGIVSIFMMKTFGRKSNLTVSPFIQGLSLILILVSLYTKIKELSYVGVVFFCLFYATGFGGTMLAYLTEILPPKGVSISITMQWITNSLLTKLLPILSNIIGDESLIFIFAVCCFTICITISTIMIETKGKSDETVIEEFKTRGYKFLNFN